MLKRSAKWLVRKVVNALRKEGFYVDLRNVTNRPMIYLGDFKALTRTNFGHKIMVDTRDISLAPHILLDGNWEPWIANFIGTKIQEGFNILEVGANIGYYTIMLASLTGEKGKVYSFEVNPRMCDLVHQSLSINGLLERVCLTNKAVYNKSCKISFSFFNNYIGSSSVIDFPASTTEYFRDSIRRVEVDAITLDEFFQDKQPRIDFIKIDAEGSEPYIFGGMKKLLNDNPGISLVIEFNPGLITAAGNDARAFLEGLVAQGFKLRYIDKQSNLVESSIDELVKMNDCELYLER